jgi:carboxylesterase type B
MTSSVSVDVGSYGKVKGFTTGNVAEFRGVPFATTPARFRRPELINSVEGGTVDATKYGPMPPQAPYDFKAFQFLFGDYVKTWTEEMKLREMNEEKCLSLNVVAPKDAIGKGKKLPVMCWIYGILLPARN